MSKRLDNLSLIKIYKSTGDKEVLNKLIEENYKLIYFVIKRFTCKTIHFDKEDLIQEGYIGLIKAIEMFNLDYNYNFSTYAIKYISGYMSKYITKHNRNELSLNVSYDSDEEIELLDQLADKENSYIDVDDRLYNDYLHQDLEEGMSILEADEKNILKARNGYYSIRPLTLKEVSKIVNVDANKINYIEKKALSKIRRSNWYRLKKSEYVLDKYEYNYCYKCVDDKLSV